jgi:hypothetical protein
VTEPEPAVVPVNVTEQLLAERVQEVALKVPPVVPAVSVKVTVPVGMLEALVVSVTVAVTLAEQLLTPNAMLQLTPPTVVEVLSFDGAVTVNVTVAVRDVEPV